MPTSPLKTPAGYVPQMAIAFANANGDADLVSAVNPIPTQEQPFVAATPLSGSASASGQFGPFAARAGRAIVLTLSGTWTGTAKLLRSVDGGTTKLPLTAAGLPYGVYTGNVCEPVWEESEAAAVFYLDVTLSAGTLAYRMGQ
jgi:hypothetical protein